MRLSCTLQKLPIWIKIFVLAYFHLAKILTNPSEYDQAYRNYETALEIDPNLADGHYWFSKLVSGGESLNRTVLSLRNLRLKEQKTS